MLLVVSKDGDLCPCLFPSKKWPIHGSSSYVKISAQIGRFFFGEFRHTFYTQKEDPGINGLYPNDLLSVFSLESTIIAVGIFGNEKVQGPQLQLLGAQPHPPTLLV